MCLLSWVIFTWRSMGTNSCMHKGRKGRTQQKGITSKNRWLSIRCFLLLTSQQIAPAPCVHACIFSWHNLAIRVTLMHHIYLLFITGRICPDWLRIFLWQLFSQRLFQSILEFCIFSVSLIPLNKDKEGGGFHSAIFQTFQAPWAFLCRPSQIRIENGCEVTGWSPNMTMMCLVVFSRDLT